MSELAERQLIVGARIFDGTDVIDADSVLITGGVIADIGSGIRANVGDEVVEAHGATLLPGLIDAHAHVGSRGALGRALRFGVTTVCDMFMDWRLARQLKDDESAGQAADLASLRSAGTLITAPGGHGSRQLVGSIPTLAPSDDADAFVAARVEEGSDWIKAVHDDFSALGEHLPTLDRKVLTAVVEAAHRRARKVIVHIGTLEGARTSVTAGADILGHWVTDAEPDQDLIDDLMARGIAVMPTLSMLASMCGQSNAHLLGDPRLAPYLSERDRADLARCIRAVDDPARLTTAHAGVRALAAAGVPLLAGTDAPFPGLTHGASLHGELQALVAAGLSPPAALAAATSLPAQHLGLTDRGRIAPGLRADLVLVAGDPLSDITATRDLLHIWKQGRRVERQPEARRRYRTPTIPATQQLARRHESVVLPTFGAGWAPFTDQVIGGRSSANVRAIDDPTAPGGWAIDVTGSLNGDGPSLWSGIALSPGDAPLEPADLSTWDGITVFLRGDENRTTAVMLVLASRGKASPPTQALPVTRDWTEHHIRWNDLDNSDGHDVRALAVIAAGPPGPFQLQLAQPTLQPTRPEAPQTGRDPTQA